MTKYAVLQITYMKSSKTFVPPFCIRGPHVQAILASNKVRTWGKNPMVDAEEEMVLEVGDGARLQGYFSPQVYRKPRGLVILLHGWEGSAESSYILSSGRYLYRHAYDIFRLNFRDHGDSHHLNEGLFLGTLIDEVFNAVKAIARMGEGNNVFIVGFSMGGNFALRIARRCSREPIENLKHIACISPALDPYKSTTAVDNDRLFRWYFLRKWKRSLLKKQGFFPAIYDFTDILQMTRCMEMTDVLVARYTDFKDSIDYFQRYTLLNNSLVDIAVPTTMITSADDPLIPIEDFHQLQLNKLTNLIVHHYGGHNGFIKGLLLRTWYDERIVQIFEETA
jgi:predicted alpha/beta-fold hydrolase